MSRCTLLLIWSGEQESTIGSIGRFVTGSKGPAMTKSELESALIMAETHVVRSSLSSRGRAVDVTVFARAAVVNAAAHRRELLELHQSRVCRNRLSIEA